MQKPEIPKNEKERLKALNNYQILDSLPEQIFDDATFIASQICKTPIALVSLIDKDRQWFKSKVGLDADETHRDISFCGHAINEPHKIFEVKNAKEDDRFSDNPLVEGDLNIGFYAGAPLTDTDGMPLGTLCVIDQKPSELDEEQKKALKALARDVVYKIESRKREMELKNKAQVDKELLELLEKNNFRYQSLIESAPLGIVLSDLKGNILQTNEVFEELLGYSKKELQKMNVPELTYPEDIKDTKSNMQRLMKGEVKQFTMEKRYICKQGELIWGRVSSAFVPDANGKPAYLIGTIEDITEKKKLQEALAINSERLELALKATNDGIWDRKDLQEDEEWWSDQFHTLLGYKEGEIEQSYTSFTNNLLHPDEIAMIDKAMIDCIENDIPLDVEHRLRQKNGDYKWFRARANVVKTNDAVPYRISGTITDIEKQKQAELELLKIKNFLEDVTDIVPNIIYIFNQKTMSNEYANRELGTSLGYTVEEIQKLGKDLMPSLCHPEDLNKVFEHFGTVAQLEDGVVAKVEYRMKHKDGKYRWLLSEDTVFERDHDGSLLKQLGVATDITDLKEVEGKLLKQAKQLQKRNEDLKQFTYIATHDLKSPIVTIEGYFKLLTKELQEKTPKTALALKHIEKEIEKFTQTQEGLREAIKIREDRFTLEKKNVSELLKEILDSYQLDIGTIEGSLVLNIEPNLYVKTNVVYFKSIIQNLVSNAIKYRSPDRALDLKVIAKKDKKKLHLIVEDNGLGIDLKLQQNRIFGMFNRFHNHSEGSGMGLYIVKSMVEKLKGNISLISEVDKGTSFHLEFNLIKK